MAITSIITNASGKTVEINVYSSMHSNARKPILLEPGEEYRVNRITPEVRALVDGGTLTLKQITIPVPPSTAVTTKAFVADPSTDLAFVHQGFAWPQLGTEPTSMDFRDNVRRFIANDKFAILEPRKKQDNIDIDWRNCHRGPHYLFRQSFESDFVISVDVEADGGLSEYDWAGMIAVSRMNPFRFARISIGSRVIEGALTPVFERVFQADKELSDPFYTSKEIGFFDESESPLEWSELSAGRPQMTSLISRFLKDRKQAARLVIRRNGPLLYLIGDDYSNTEQAKVIMQNFLEGPIVIAFAIGRYPSHGSRFAGAVFENLQGAAEKS